MLPRDPTARPSPAWRGAALCAALLAVAGAGLYARSPGASAASLVALPAPAGATLPNAATQAAGLQTVVLSGGCFWGVQGVFEHVRGVTRAVSSYAGGEAATARYELVSTGATGHAESVEVTFDPGQVSYAQVLRIFFSVALDPTEVDRQGPDSGTQYRSEVFVRDAAQAGAARAYIAQLDAAQAFARPIATRVDRLDRFYPAEAHHQDFLVRHPDFPYIAAFDMPKVAALQRLFPAQYVETPVTVQPDAVQPGTVRHVILQPVRDPA